MIKEINNLEEFNALINQDKLVVVDFWAEWCAPCRAISPFFDRLAEETAQAEFAKLNADKAPDVVELVRISGLPTFFFYRNGKRVSIVSGTDGYTLRRRVEQLA